MLVYPSVGVFSSTKIIKRIGSRAWWRTPVIPMLGRLKQEDKKNGKRTGFEQKRKKVGCELVTAGTENQGSVTPAPLHMCLKCPGLKIQIRALLAVTFVPDCPRVQEKGPGKSTSHALQSRKRKTSPTQLKQSYQKTRKNHTLSWTRLLCLDLVSGGVWYGAQEMN